MKLARVALPYLIIIIASGCATRTTLGELGHPAFDDALAPSEKLALATGVERDAGEIAGWVGSEPDSSRDFATRGTVESREGGLDGLGKPGDIIYIVSVHARSDAEKIALLEVAAFPLEEKDVSRYVVTGRVPAGAKPLAQARSIKADPDGWLAVGLILPRSMLKGAKRIALPRLVRFERGWLHVGFPSVPAPE